MFGGNALMSLLELDGADLPDSSMRMDEGDDGVLEVLLRLDALLVSGVEAMTPLLSALISTRVPHAAIMTWSESCSRAPLHAGGDGEALAELDMSKVLALAVTVEPDVPVRRRMHLGGRNTSVLAVASGLDGRRALMILILDEERAPDPGADEFVQRVWTLVEGQLAARARHAHPADLSASRAAAGERSRVAARLADEHAAVLQALLGTLRDGAVVDEVARRSATDMASRALVELRNAALGEQHLGEERAEKAFKRLAAELTPLSGHGRAALSFAPPQGAVALPAQAAEGASAISRHAVLSTLDLAGVTRVTLGWSVDTDLEITVRDDGPGRIDTTAVRALEAAARLQAIDATVDVEGAPGWGTRLLVRIPLGFGAPLAPDPLEDLNQREREVLTHVAEGRRNRQIAEALDISPNTVKFHIRNLMRKLGAETRGQAAALARGAPPAS